MVRMDVCRWLSFSIPSITRESGGGRALSFSYPFHHHCIRPLFNTKCVVIWCTTNWLITPYKLCACLWWKGKASRSKGATTKEDLLIEQVRVELESYFAPQNIQNDYNLRQKMTTDGFIDINLLLDLKLMQDLVTNRDLLIEAISRSKLLKMNTGCTMVKYMPILERNILILRDIPDKTMKEEIMQIFDNEHCSAPYEVHSDIGNHWFCRFQTEEECLATAQHLNLHGTFKGEKLHVRVKAIHDKNKADTSPQMQNAGSSKSSKSKRANAAPQPPQPYGPSMPYSPGSVLFLVTPFIMRFWIQNRQNIDIFLVLNFYKNELPKCCGFWYFWCYYFDAKWPPKSREFWSFLVAEFQSIFSVKIWW